MSDHQSMLPILLLVEDDKSLRGLLETGLTDEGFEVVVAIDGAEGIAALEGAAVPFRGLITDIRLGPGPSGWEVGKRAREIISGLPVIYMSGDSAQEWSANGVPESVMIQKPFVIAQLITAVSTLLNNAGNASALSDAMSSDGHS